MADDAEIVAATQATLRLLEIYKDDIKGNSNTGASRFEVAAKTFKEVFKAIREAQAGD